MVMVLNNGKTNSDASKFIRDGLIVAQLRGMDSTGILQVDRKDLSFMYKQATSASNFLDLRHSKVYLDDAGVSRFTLGHVRAATHGKVTSNNAHPFEVKKADGTGYVQGVHNGSLWGWASREDAKGIEVDSEWALQRIADDGDDAFADFTGAYCFMWYDNSLNNRQYMNIVRNADRPMHLVMSECKKHAYFASEAEMLQLVCQRNKIKTQDTIYSIEENMHYRFDLRSDEVSWSKTKVPVAKAATAYSYNNGYYNYKKDEYDDSWYDGQGTLPKPRTPAGPATSITPPAAGGSVIIPDAARAALKRWKKAMSIEIPATKSTTHLSLVDYDDDDPDNILSSSLDSYKAPSSWYSEATSTKAEKAAAKSTGMFGEIVFMSGVVYEPSTCEIFGDIADFDKSMNTKATFTGVARGFSAHSAHNTWGDGAKAKGNWGVVIGEYNDLTTNERTFVVSDFNTVGKEKFNQEMAV